MSKKPCLPKLLLAVILVFAFAMIVSADPVRVNASVDSQTRLTLVVRRDDPLTVSQTTTPFPFGPSQSGFWTIRVTVTESNGNNDEVLLNIFVQHSQSPTGHGDGEGSPINFSIGVNAINAAFAGGGNLGTVTTNMFTVVGQASAAVFSIPHGPNDHLDLLTATFLATVDRTGGQNNITSWTATVDVVHTPEPATILLLGAGLAGVGIKFRKRRKSD